MSPPRLEHGTRLGRSTGLAFGAWPARLDTGMQIVPDIKKYVKAIPKASRLDVVSEMLAAKFEGLDPAMVRKMCEFRSFSHLRWPSYFPEKLPNETKVIIVWGDRTHHVGTKQKYSAIQGIDRFCEGGLDQIDEVHVPMPPKCPPDHPCAKFGGMAKAFEIHFRFMHTESVFREVKAQAFDKIGMF